MSVFHQDERPLEFNGKTASNTRSSQCSSYYIQRAELLNQLYSKRDKLIVLNRLIMVKVEDILPESRRGLFKPGCSLRLEDKSEDILDEIFLPNRGAYAGNTPRNNNLIASDMFFKSIKDYEMVRKKIPHRIVCDRNFKPIKLRSIPSLFILINIIRILLRLSYRRAVNVENRFIYDENGFTKHIYALFKSTIKRFKPLTLEDPDYFLYRDLFSQGNIGPTVFSASIRADPQLLRRSVRSNPMKLIKSETSDLNIKSEVQIRVPKDSLLSPVSKFSLKFEKLDMIDSGFGYPISVDPAYWPLRYYYDTGKFSLEEKLNYLLSLDGNKPKQYVKDNLNVFLIPHTRVKDKKIKNKFTIKVDKLTTCVHSRERLYYNSIVKNKFINLEDLLYYNPEGLERPWGGHCGIIFSKNDGFIRDISYHHFSSARGTKAWNYLYYTGHSYECPGIDLAVKIDSIRYGQEILQPIGYKYLTDQLIDQYVFKYNANVVSLKWNLYNANQLLDLYYTGEIVRQKFYQSIDTPQGESFFLYNYGENIFSFRFSIYISSNFFMRMLLLRPFEWSESEPTIEVLFDHKAKKFKILSNGVFNYYGFVRASSDIKTPPDHILKGHPSILESFRIAELDRIRCTGILYPDKTSAYYKAVVYEGYLNYLNLDWDSYESLRKRYITLDLNQS